MKKILLILILGILFQACKKKEAAKPTSGTPTTTGDTSTYVFIKTWKSDTLNAGSVNYYDGLLTFKTGDTSALYYHGEKLYVFYHKYGYGSSYNDSSAAYENVYIGPVCFDTAAAYTTCMVIPYKCWNPSYNAWRNQNSEIIIHRMYPHFDTAHGAYYYHL